jgi:hypothetical protein
VLDLISTGVVRMMESRWADVGPAGLRTKRKQPDWCWAERKKRNKRNAGPAEFWSRGIANLFYILFKTL